MATATAGHGGSGSRRRGNRGVEVGGVGFGPVDETMRGQLSQIPSMSPMAHNNKRSDMRLLLGIMGAPLPPLHVSTSDPLPHLSIKDTPIMRAVVREVAKYFPTAVICGRSRDKVQNLIERCVQLYMNKDEVVNTLLDRACIEPDFTNLVWQKLEEKNSEFFKAYNIRPKLKNQIYMYNQLLQQQYHQLKEQAPTNVAIAPVQNGMQHMTDGAVNNLPMGYLILQ